MKVATWRRIAFGSIAVYAVSLVLPAVISTGDSMLGWEAVLDSLICAGFLFGDDPSFRMTGVACALGFAANVFYILAYVVLLMTLANRRQGVAAAATTFAILSLVLALASIVVLIAISQPSASVNYGAIVWILSMAMLSRGSWPPPLTDPGGFPVVLAES